MNPKTIFIHFMTYVSYLILALLVAAFPATILLFNEPEWERDAKEEREWCVDLFHENTMGRMTCHYLPDGRRHGPCILRVQNDDGTLRQGRPLMIEFYAAGKLTIRKDLRFGK